MAQLTDREAWETYLKPGIERAERLKAIREGRDVDEPPPVELTTVEDELAYMRRLGVVGVPESNP